MPLVEQKKQRKAHRPVWPLLVAVLGSVLAFVIVAGVIAFVTRDDGVGRAEVEPHAPLKVVPLPDAARATAAAQVQESVRPCVVESIRLDPAAANHVDVEVQVTLQGPDVIVTKVAQSGFVSPYVTRCLAKQSLPQVGLRYVDRDVEAGAPGKATFVLQIRK